MSSVCNTGIKDKISHTGHSHARIASVVDKERELTYLYSLDFKIGHVGLGWGLAQQWRLGLVSRECESLLTIWGEGLQDQGVRKGHSDLFSSWNSEMKLMEKTFFLTSIFLVPVPRLIFYPL